MSASAKRRVCELHSNPEDCYYSAYMCRNRPAPKPSLFTRIAHRVLWVLGGRKKTDGGL
jgi:hypothetical protein